MDQLREPLRYAIELKWFFSQDSLYQSDFYEVVDDEAKDHLCG